MYCLSHLNAWLEQYESDPTAVEVRDMVRDMNCATSQKVFIGESLHPRPGGQPGAALGLARADARQHMFA
jgi:hypothetical protein